MKYGSELRIGITGVVTVLVIIWGINFLKGRNVLNSNYLLIAQYEEVDGLEASANVMLNGFKIGSVDQIVFETEKSIPFTITLEIDKRYKLKQGSIAEIYSADLLGSKAIKIIPSSSTVYVASGDTLHSQIAGDMIDALFEEIQPLTDNIEVALKTLDSVGISINTILNDPGTKALLLNLEGMSTSLNKQFSPEGDISKSLSNLKKVSYALSTQNTSIQNTLANLDSISGTIKDSNLDSLINNLALIGQNLGDITSAINTGKGSLGKLFNEDSLYSQINILISDLDSLINDVNSNPKKYVHFSLFGR